MITNGLATFSAVLTAMCFSASSAEKEGSSARANFKACARLFFIALLAGAMSSFTKYSITHFPVSLPKLYVRLGGFTAGIIFFAGMISASIGFWRLIEELFRKDVS
jgi:hypothetical protein